MKEAMSDMKDLIIVGAGDFGREVAWLVERINEQSGEWSLLGFADDSATLQGRELDGYPVLGTIAELERWDRSVYIVCSVNNCGARQEIMTRLLKNKRLLPATLIDPTAVIGRNVQIGSGCIVCAGTVTTINGALCDGTIVNLSCTIGHDTRLMPYCTIYPGCNLSGKVTVGERVTLGTGSKIIQGINICADAVVGAGAVVVRSVTEPGVYVGVPARKLP